MQSEQFKISGMSCHHCVMAVKNAISKLNIQSAEVVIGEAKVSYDEAGVRRDQIVQAIEEAGYKVVQKT